jgi:hypothetical protein
VESAEYVWQVAHYPLLLASITPSNVAGVLFPGGGFGYVLSAGLAANPPDEHPHQHWGRAFNLAHHPRPDKMKFFGVLFIILGIMLLLAAFLTASQVYDAFYIPPAATDPAWPQATGLRRASQLADNALLAYLGIAAVFSLAFIGQGSVMYSVGDLHDKIDDLKHGR